MSDWFRRMARGPARDPHMAEMKRRSLAILAKAHAAIEGLAGDDYDVNAARRELEQLMAEREAYVRALRN